MQGEVAKTFYEMQTPINKPKELPYVVELFKKFQEEKCPNIEMPKWLGGESTKIEEPIPTIHLKSLV